MTDQKESAKSVLYYHTKEEFVHSEMILIKLPRVSVCATVEQVGNDVAMEFGFSRCASGDQFDHKFGREQAQLRAEKDPSFVIGFKTDNPSAKFVAVAKALALDVMVKSEFGRSLISPLKLEKPARVVVEKIPWTKEQIDTAKKQKLGQFLAAEAEGIV